ncbi:MAG: hypothetical protein IKS15_03535 [Opitutales bacterium]|nr:hypothetical protein [Opitutales bacterium]
MKKLAINLFLLPCLVLVCACQHVNVKGDGTPDIHKTETIHGSYYNFYWSEYKPVKTAGRVPLYRVRVGDNYLYALAGVLSLGLYRPLDIEYWTAKTEKDGEIEEDWAPAK